MRRQSIFNNHITDQELLGKGNGHIFRISDSLMELKRMATSGPKLTTRLSVEGFKKNKSIVSGDAVPVLED